MSQHSIPVTESSYTITVGIKPHLFTLLGYCLLALIATYPTILNFTTQVPGELIADRDQHYWSFWWLSQAFSQPTNPFHTQMLYFPYGVPLYYHVLGIPLWIIGLLPMLVWGYPAAYNTVVIAAFVLSGYAAFRLALLVTKNPWASFIGGIVFAFTPYTLGAIADGQNEVFSIFWIPLFAECWLRAWQFSSTAWRGRIVALSLAGLFFAAGAYTTLYYPVDIAIFIAVYAAYALITRPDRRATLLRLISNSAIMGVVALLLMAPLLAGLAANFRNPRLDIDAGETQMIGHSADLAGLIAFPHDHPLTGSSLYGTAKLPVRDNLTLGWFALALAVLGAVASWRNRTANTRFWVALGLVAIIMAMGPYLQLTATNVTSIPLPYKLLTNIPIFSGLGKVERFIALTRLSMGILSAWGALYIFSKLSTKRTPEQTTRKRAPAIYFAAIVALLFVELPLHPRYTEPFNISPGFYLLARQPPGGLMELPFATQQNTIVGERMINQTVHNHPIMAGYLARNYNSPIIDSCSPFWGFISPLDVPREDIASPLVVNRPQDVLNFYNINYIALYEKNGGPQADPVDPALKTAFTFNIIAEVQESDPFYRDSYISLYKVKNWGSGPPATSFHIGAGWYNIEQSGGKPFRWVKEGAATLCVFAPRQITASLNLEATAFAQSKHISISAAGHELFRGNLPANAFTPLTTAPIEWQPGVTEVHITASEPGITPHTLDPKIADNRPLTVGIRGVNLVIAPQK